MSKKPTHISWGEFRHTLAGNGFSQEDVSVLYQKYKVGVILDKELDDPVSLKVYLQKKDIKQIPKSKKTTKPKTYEILRKKLLNKTLNETFIHTLGTYGNEEDLAASEEFVEGFKGNKKETVNNIIEDMIEVDKIIASSKWSRETPNDQTDDWLYWLASRFLYMEEYDLAYKYYNLNAETQQTKSGSIDGDPNAMHKMYLMLASYLNVKSLDVWKEKNFKDAYWTGIRWLIRGYQEGNGEMATTEVNALESDDLIDYLEIYESKLEESDTKIEKLEQKITKLEAKNKILEDKVVDLTYRPPSSGGPGFERVRSRHVGRYGIKK